jgi:hypothetical protein
MRLGLLNEWIGHAGRWLPLLAGLLSVGILFGCAVASWIAPPEEEDDLFHREVI